MIKIKQASIIHIDALHQLFEEYREFYEMVRADQKSKRFLTQRLNKRDSIILIAFNNQEAAGFTQIYPSFSSVAMQPLWVLNDLYVTEKQRKKGIARKLLVATEALAKEHKIFSVKLATATDNVEAQSLYKSSGYHLVDNFKHYSKRLNTG